MQHRDEHQDAEPVYGVTWEEATPVSEEVRRYERIAAELSAETDRLHRAAHHHEDSGEPMTTPLPPLTPTREQIHQPTDEPHTEDRPADDAQEPKRKPARAPRRPRRARRPIGPAVRARLAQAGVSSAYYARRGITQHAQTAAEWVRAEGLEEHIRTRAEAARADAVRTAQISHTKQMNQLAREAGKRGTVATAAIAAPQMPREVSETSIVGKAWLGRARRGLVCLAVPTGLVALPPWLALDAGAWWTLAAWPIAYGYLAWHGWVYRDEESAPPQVDIPQPRKAGGTVVGATRAEAAILERLNRWEELAPAREIKGVHMDDVTISDIGIIATLSTTGKLTLVDLKERKKAAAVRAVLGVPEGVRTQFAPGETADQVVLKVRTREKEHDLMWNPDREGLGLFADTGEIVKVGPYGHRLIAGTTGAGKSVAVRPWLCDVVLNPKAALVFIDPKGQEYGLWEHCARTIDGVGTEGKTRIYNTIREVAAEVEYRQKNSTGTTWECTEEHPELVVFIDEGASLVRMAKDKDYKDLIDMVEFIATQSRASKVWIYWATQYPTKEGGIPPQVAECLTTRVCLMVDGDQADRVMFGSSATSKGWTPSELPPEGWFYVRAPKEGYVSPEVGRVWFADDDQVRALPKREPWHHGAAPAGSAAEMPEVLALALEMSEGLKGLSSENFFKVAEERLGLMDFDVTKVFREHGIEREPGPFQTGEGRARGWRREVIEKGAARYRR